MIFNKVSKIFSVDGDSDLLHSHSSCPVPVVITPHLIRVFFSGRGLDQKARVFCFDYCLSQERVLAQTLSPVLDVGAPCFFDDCGVYPSSYLEVGERHYLYYMGRTNKSGNFYSMAIGRCELEQDLAGMKREFIGPVFNANKYDPWMVSTPWVYPVSEGFKMFYLSGLGWSNDLKESHYVLKVASSPNGIDWTTSDSCFEPTAQEKNVAKPCLVTADQQSYLVFSYIPRGQSKYRIGYVDMNNQQCGISVPDFFHKSGEQLEPYFAYPTLVKIGKRVLGFFSSFDLGRSGIYVAEMELNKP